MAKKKYNNIFEAIWENNIEAVKTFLPAQLEMSNDSGLTPLHLACYICHTKIARLLLDYGADIDVRDKDGCTALHCACQVFDNLDYYDIATVRLLLDRGADINAKDKYGRTPLHIVYEYEYPLFKTSELLVKRGADPFIKNNYGESPLDYDCMTVKNKGRNKILHKEILIQLRTEYLNKHAIKESEHTAALSSGWEMEL